MTISVTQHSVPNFKNKLSWFKSEEGQYGWLPPSGKEHIYDENYFKKYVEYSEGEVGKNIQRARLAFTLGHIDISDYMVFTDVEISICDVGIGSGTFIEDLNRGILRGKVFGSDINPYAIKWLKDKRMYMDPEKEHPDVLTLWDVLEHMEDPDEFIKTVSAEYVFVSMPIYKSLEHCLSSKHLKPDEHIWYYTEEALINTFKVLGYNLLEVSDVETLVGREDILSFAFKKNETAGLPQTS